MGLFWRWVEKMPECPWLWIWVHYLWHPSAIDLRPLLFIWRHIHKLRTDNSSKRLIALRKIKLYKIIYSLLRKVAMSCLPHTRNFYHEWQKISNMFDICFSRDEWQKSWIFSLHTRIFVARNWSRMISVRATCTSVRRGLEVMMRPWLAAW